MQPLVSVICLCYNHEQFLREAIESVINQTYPQIEIILCDDASADQSQLIARQLSVEFPSVSLLLLDENIGNCGAFNRAYKRANGSYIIDFSTDDVMLPDRIEKQVRLFQTLGAEYGVVFSDAEYIDQSNRHIRNHFEYLFKKRLIRSVASGDVYEHVLSKYYIPSPTMMVRREVYEALNGYDETLSYEDFDFWIRSSRIFKYAYLDEITTKIRVLNTSLSQAFFKGKNRHTLSTYKVCLKAKSLNRTPSENTALSKRVSYELRQAILSGSHPEAKLFQQLLQQLGHYGWRDRWWVFIGETKTPLWRLRRFYNRIRFNR